MIDRNLAIHCERQVEAKILCNYLKRKGQRWCNGNSYDNIYWEEYKENTLYFISTNEFGSIEYAIDEYYTILKFKEFYIKEIKPRKKFIEVEE